MHDLTHQKILTMLEGCSSAKPMEFDTLIEKTGLLPDTLAMVLAQMQHSLPATINSCIITRAGKSRTVYWPTGASLDKQGNSWRETATVAHIPAPTIRSSAAALTAYNKVRAEPGLLQSNLINQLIGGGYSYSTAYNAIARLVQSKYITRTGRAKQCRLSVAGAV
jgi:hypothetical protein